MSEKTMQIALPYDRAQQKRLRRFCGLMDYPSVRAFVYEAIEMHVSYKLNNLPQEDRELVEEALDR